MHVAEFFDGAPTEPEEVDAGDHVEVPDDVPVDVQTKVSGRVQADVLVEGMGDTHEQQTTADPVVSLGSL